MAIIRQSYGTIALLDALGTRTSNLDESVDYIEKFKSIREEIESAKKNNVGDLSFENIATYFFGDTLLLTLECPKGYEELNEINKLAFIVSYIIYFSIEKGILFRGAISVGDYIEDEGTVLGPALTDAAYWYEKAELIGVMATPKTTMHLNYLIEATEPNMSDFKMHWCNRRFDTKEGSQSGFLINWPFIPSIDSHEQKKWFYQHFGSLHRTPTDELKYKNTEVFFTEEMARALGNNGAV